MKTTQQEVQRRGRDKTGNGNPLRIEVVTPQDRKRFDRLLGQYHYLGETCAVGDFLRQVAILDGEWVGLLAWGAACYALKDRDQYIGWTPTWRAERQKLIVQNRRFLLLNEKVAQPNLASRILGACVKALPEQWQAYFGYVPLLAETFTDIEAFAGTCYKAAGWIPLGRTKGFSRHRADFSCPTTGPRSSGSSRCGRTPWRCCVDETERVDEQNNGVELLVANFPSEEENAEEEGIINFSFIGRPNVGKSSLVNAILGEERVIVSDIAGTTRDAIDTMFVDDEGAKFRMIDTAGIRKKGKVYESTEKYSVMRAIRAIERSDIVMVVLNAEEGIQEQDKKVAGYAHEAGKGIIILVNKWDTLEKDNHTMKEFEDKIRKEFQYLSMRLSCMFPR